MKTAAEKAAALIANLKKSPAEKLEEVRKQEFPLGGSRVLKVHRLREKEARKSRKAVRHLVRSENMRILGDSLPEEQGDRTHAVIPGDFEFCDFLSVMSGRLGEPTEMHLTSLSLSLENVREIERLCRAFPKCSFTLAISYFFRSTSKEIFAAMETRLGPLGNLRFSTGRLHTKIVLMRIPRPGNEERCIVVETSANLRACRNLEQVTIYDDPELFAFHRDWITEFHTLAETGGFEHMISFSKKPL